MGKLVVAKVDFGSPETGRLYTYDPDLTSLNTLDSYEFVGGSGYSATMLVRDTGSKFWYGWSRGGESRIAYYDGVSTTATSTDTGAFSYYILNNTAFGTCQTGRMVIFYDSQVWFLNPSLVREALPYASPCDKRGLNLQTHSLSWRGVYNADFFEVVNWYLMQCARRPKPLRQKQRDDFLNAPRASRINNSPTSRQDSLRATSINSYH
jgi:hypothetical protein